MMPSIAVLGMILVIFALIVVWELKIESANEYYNCYYEMFYKNRAIDFKCCGSKPKLEYCKNCPYYKRYKKENDAT